MRTAKPEDAEAICHIHVTSVRELCASDYTLEQIEAWVGNLDPEKRCRSMAQNTESEILFVAENNQGVIVGFSSLGQHGEVNAVYVHPQYTRQGVGRVLLDAVESEAIARHVEKLKLSASTNAQPFYQSCGYQIIEHSFHTLRSGVQIPCVKMEKFLL